MKKNIQFIALLMSITIGILACNQKPLDEIEPFYKLTENNTFSSAKNTELVLNGLYGTWRNFWYVPGYLYSYGGYYDHRNTSDFGLNLLEAEAGNSDIKLAYERYYELIQKANYIIHAMQNIEDIPGLSAARRTEIEADARMQRAMGHFELLRIFGQSWDLNSTLGIVVNMDVVRENVPKARNTVQEAYDAIIEDLEFAAGNAIPDYKNAIRMTQVTAKGLLAQVLLTMNDYSGAAKYAQEVMNDTRYTLEDDFREIYKQGYRSKEQLFSPYSFAFYENIADLLSFHFRYTESLEILADKEFGLPDDGDIKTGEGYDPRFAFAHSADTRVNNRYNTKYPFRTMLDSQANSYHILRVAEMYLIYAEAKARLATGVDADAVEALNTIRARAGVPPKNPQTKEALLEDIRIEKVLELFGEWAQPWHDMVRLSKLGDINITDFRPNITSDQRLVWPIPIEAMRVNNLLIQNPGY